MNLEGAVASPVQLTPVKQLRTWGRLVKFSHSVFALPFALSMAVVVLRRQPITAGQIGWILLALVSARTAAMAFNRLIDRDIDARNPRTRSREIPAGAVSPRSARTLVLISSCIFFAAAAGLGKHCLVLAPAVLGLLMFYSLTKRFTRYSHIVLGLALALAPGGVWYALTAEVALLPLALMLAVLLWVAGFDIIYSCQDVEFDRSAGLHSLPAKLGVARALLLSRVFHLIAIACLAAFGWMAGLGTAYYIGLVVFGSVLLYQHRLVSPRDLSRVDAAFFTVNGIASVCYFLSVLADYLCSLC